MPEPERASLFVPCLTEHLDARAAEATTRLLLHLGVVLLNASQCCGFGGSFAALSVALGHHKLAPAAATSSPAPPRPPTSRAS